MKKITLFLLTALTVFNASAQLQTDSELKNLINASFNYFPKVKEAETAAKIAEEKLALTELNRKPIVDFNTNYSLVMPKISFPINGRDFQFAPVNNISSSVGINYSLYDFGKLIAVIDKEKAELNISKHQIENVKAELANQVATVYFNIIYLKQLIPIQDSVIAFFNANKTIAESRLKNGEAIKSEVLNIQSNIDQEENKKLDLISALEKQEVLLAYLCGKNNVSTSAFNSSMMEFEKTLQSNQQNIFNNAAIAISEDNITVAKKELEIIKKSNKPSLSLHAGSGIRNGYVPEVNDLRFNYMAGVSFLVPVYDFGRKNQRLKMQQLAVHENEIAKEGLIESTNKDIKQTKIEIHYATEKIKHAESQIDAARIAQQIVASQFQHGTATSLDIIAAATNVQKAGLAKLQSELQLAVAVAALAKTTGLEYWKN